MNEQDLIEFYKNYKWTDPVPMYYRLYHDDAGKPQFYSREDLPGKYIDITPAQFVLQDWSVKVVDEKIVRQKTARMSKLIPAESGTLCHANDVSVIVDAQPGQYWKKTENVVETN